MTVYVRQVSDTLSPFARLESPRRYVVICCARRFSIKRPNPMSLTLLLALGLTACAPALQNGAPNNRVLVLRLVRDGLTPANAAVVQRLVAEHYVEHDPQVAAG